MKCPGCGSKIRGVQDVCDCCGTPVRSSAAADELPLLRFASPHAAAGEPALDTDPIEVGESDLDGALSDAAGVGAALPDSDAGQPFRIDDDLFFGHEPALGGASPAPDPLDWSQHRDLWPEAGADLPGPAFILADEEHPGPSGAEPIIDRDDEVPERYWAPEVADLGRRGLALLVDQSVLVVVLGLFLLGAAAALRLNGIDGGLLLAATGLRASALPFALLGVSASLVYSVYFHGSTGRTPGKALVGIEVRKGDGGSVSWGRAALRWFGAVLGTACAGVGILWALLEPRRRGWADLLSGTLVTRPQRERSPGAPRR